MGGHGGYRWARWGALAGLVLSLLVAWAASADTITSHNWSGYAVHGPGMRFKQVSASWRQPAATCARGRTTYSAMWVGIGGYRLDSQAIEQVGTELDCNSDGAQSISAWYELVPAADQAIPMVVGAGDLIRAGVSISHRRVTVMLADLTRGESFTRVILARKLDTSSAEWIVEAPSGCVGTEACKTLPLADFGTARFGGLRVQPARGPSGTVASPRWTATKILLGYTRAARSFIARASTAHATPSVLLESGDGFTVRYSPPTAR